MLLSVVKWITVIRLYEVCLISVNGNYNALRTLLHRLSQSKSKCTRATQILNRHGCLLDTMVYASLVYTFLSAGLPSFFRLVLIPCGREDKVRKIRWNVPEGFSVLSILAQDQETLCPSLHKIRKHFDHSFSLMLLQSGTNCQMISILLPLLPLSGRN